MNQAFICDAVRTPFGRFAGTLATMRADDLAALPLKALLERRVAPLTGCAAPVLMRSASQRGPSKAAKLS